MNLKLFHVWVNDVIKYIRHCDVTVFRTLKSLVISCFLTQVGADLQDSVLGSVISSNLVFSRTGWS